MYYLFHTYLVYVIVYYSHKLILSQYHNWYLPSNFYLIAASSSFLRNSNCRWIILEVWVASQKLIDFVQTIYQLTALSSMPVLKMEGPNQTSMLIAYPHLVMPVKPTISWKKFSWKILALMKTQSVSWLSKIIYYHRRYFSYIPYF